MPVAIRRLSPATRIMKNSSRLLLKMARNLARSSSGMSSSMASWRTRSLSCSQEISRSRNRSAGSSSGGRMNRPFAARGWNPRGEVIALASERSGPSSAPSWTTSRSSSSRARSDSSVLMTSWFHLKVNCRQRPERGRANMRSTDRVVNPSPR